MLILAQNLRAQPIADFQPLAPLTPTPTTKSSLALRHVTSLLQTLQMKTLQVEAVLQSKLPLFN